MLRTHLEQWEQEQFKKGIEKGIEKGFLTGEAVILRRQLKLRFSPLPTWVDDTLSHATREQLEHWSERILDARSLECVFETPPAF